MVKKGYEDQELARWIQAIREKKANLRREGLEVEEIAPGGKLSTRSLTAERIERINALDFVWDAARGCEKVSWEGRFQELLEYYETNQSWPSQSKGTLGLWVQKQRKAYAKNEPKYMRTKFPKLDEIGFEWTPRGYTRMSWTEGFEFLTAFGTLNGHFDVPCPGGNKKSDAHRLYRWVESLHGMYRSYKVGRRSGSLTNERIQLLTELGFEFRNSLVAEVEMELTRDENG